MVTGNYIYYLKRFEGHFKDNMINGAGTFKSDTKVISSIWSMNVIMWFFIFYSKLFFIIKMSKELQYNTISKGDYLT